MIFKVLLNAQLIHKSIWEKVGGWSEEFSPTGSDDTDFAMKFGNQM